MKLIAKWIPLLCLIWLVAQTSEATENKIWDASKWGNETILSEREEAPIRGVLVPEYNYRVYQKALERLDTVNPEYKAVIDFCEEERKQAKADQWKLILWGVPVSFGVGFLLGFVLTRK